MLKESKAKKTRVIEESNHLLFRVISKNEILTNG